jgi:hypothetical protein
VTDNCLHEPSAQLPVLSDRSAWPPPLLITLCLPLLLPLLLIADERDFDGPA